MKHYLKNVWLALAGRTPYGEERAEDCAACKQLQDAARAQEALVRNLDVARVHAEQKVKEYQALMEGLRRHLHERALQIEDRRRDFAAAIETLRKQHRQQLEELERQNESLRDTIDDLQERLRRTVADVGRDMSAESMLRRTNAALNDLGTAMDADDVATMKDAVAFVGWHKQLAAIAQRHLSVLQQKQELEEKTKAANLP